MLICAIISLLRPVEADVFPGSWRTFRLFLLFSFRPTTDSVSRKTSVAPVARGLLYPFLFLTSFTGVFGHSPRSPCR